MTQFGASLVSFSAHVMNLRFNDQSCIKYSTSKYQYQYQLSKYQYKYQYWVNSRHYPLGYFLFFFATRAEHKYECKYKYRIKTSKNDKKKPTVPDRWTDKTREYKC